MERSKRKRKERTGKKKGQEREKGKERKPLVIRFNIEH